MVLLMRVWSTLGGLDRGEAGVGGRAASPIRDERREGGVTVGGRAGACHEVGGGEGDSVGRRRLPSLHSILVLQRYAQLSCLPSPP